MYRLSEILALVDPEGSTDRLNSVRQWIWKGWLHYSPNPTHVGVDPDQPPPAKGAPGFMSRHRALQVATACALVDCGVHPLAALRAAALFSDMGGAEAGYGGTPTIQRLPGGLYREGKTILGVWRSEEGPFDGWSGHVVNALHQDNYELLLHKLTRGFETPTKPMRMILLDCADVVESLKPLFNAPGDAQTRYLAKADAILKRSGAMQERLDREAAVPKAAPQKRRTTPQATEPEPTR